MTPELFYSMKIEARVFAADDICQACLAVFDVNIQVDVPEAGGPVV